MAYLTATYSYAVGDLVRFKARANNADGWGDESNPNTGGATIMTVPVAMGPPIEDAATSHAQVALTWAELTTVSDTGGTPITSYSLEWDQGSGNWAALKGDPTPDTAASYVLPGVTAGAPYDFRLRAANAIGWGAYGPTVTVVPSSVPVQMATVTTAHTASVYARITWTAPDTRGAAITAYRVLIEAADGSMTEDLAYCDGSDPTVAVNLLCEVPMEALRAPPYSLAQGSLVAAQA